MAKPKIYGSGNETFKGEFNFSYYVLEKDSSFLDWLGELLSKVFEIEDGEQQAKYIIERADDGKSDWIKDKIYVKNVRKMIDVHEKYFPKGITHPNTTQGRIDVFYGRDRVFLTIRTSREKRKEVADFVRKSKSWIKVKEVGKKKLPVYVKEMKSK